MYKVASGGYRFSKVTKLKFFKKIFKVAELYRKYCLLRFFQFRRVSVGETKMQVVLGSSSILPPVFLLIVPVMASAAFYGGTFFY